VPSPATPTFSNTVVNKQAEGERWKKEWSISGAEAAAEELQKQVDESNKVVVELQLQVTVVVVAVVIIKDRFIFLPSR
jgi:hypothetical protein